MTHNYLGADLEEILTQLDDAGMRATRVRRDLAKLVDRVVELGANPVEVDASTDLTVTSGLKPEQEIRARAADIVYPAGPSYPAFDEGVFPMLTRDAVYDEIDYMAAYIRDGSRPA